MAREIAEFMQQGGGLITVQDLKNYDVVERTPVPVVPPPPANALAAGIALSAAPQYVTQMDASRNATKPAVIVQVKDGQFKYLQSIAP